mgnify:CR=1 FL=1
MKKLKLHKKGFTHLEQTGSVRAGFLKTLEGYEETPDDVMVTLRAIKTDTEYVSANMGITVIIRNRHRERSALYRWSVRNGCKLSSTKIGHNGNDVVWHMKAVQIVGDFAYYVVYGDNAERVIHAPFTIGYERWNQALPGNAGISYRRQSDQSRHSYKRVVKRGGKIGFSRQRGNAYVP